MGAPRKPHLSLLFAALPLLGVGLAAAQDAPAGAIALGASCVTADCHPALAPGPDLHGPLNTGNCTVCHEAIDGRHEFRLARSGPALCGMCHELALSDVVHAPVVEGDCTSCHDPHRSPHEALLVQSPDEGLCLPCHGQDGLMSQPFLHGPARAGMCVVCHESHSSSNQHLVRQDGAELCAFCHGEDIARFEQSRHLHDPLRGGACLGCHDPHGGASASLTLVPAPGLCFTCHGDLEERVARSAVVHSPVSAEAACSSCHDAHGSPMPALLREGELALCTGCHLEETHTARGEVISAVGALIRDSAFPHGPVREGNCTSCHDAHAGDKARLLVSDYPPEFYAPYDARRYALCFQCHSGEAFETERTATLTNFRRGDVNLHFIHVTKDERGRTCRACHEVHASNRPFHMSETVPYGGWRMPIHFEALPGGGRCSPGCHQPETYDRGLTTASTSSEERLP
ncbi:MAG: cytochrome c3 family protein [Candidatus Sumerlaeia bacterium]|nr:cytochrome c3 family protein [Candidatus Sumerlaeia bacterium]